MPKQRSWGRARISGRFRMDHFYTLMVRDLSGYDDLSAIGADLLRADVDLRVVSESMVHKAEVGLSPYSVLPYAIARQLSALLSKNVDYKPLPPDQVHRNTMDVFAAAERQCKRVNRRITWYKEHWSRAPLALTLLNTARNFIYNAIGDLDEDIYGEILDGCAFGSGVTFGSTSQEQKNLYFKVHGPQTITSKALPHLRSYFRRNRHWYDFLTGIGAEFEIVRGDRISTVPKKWNRGRTIGIQPSLNVFLQKGVDSYLKDRLKRVGLTIRDQRRNQVVAKRSSITGTCATVDLQSASDTISRELVRYLLPPTWYSLMDDLRCEEFTSDRGANWTGAHKFSAMGNGFTFPLETLIFWGICQACLSYCGIDDRDLRVYGDDIVIDRRAALLLIETLKFAGFTTNTEKTFIHGVFRETCGADYINGVDIRPIYLARDPVTVPEVYNLYNRLLTNGLGIRYPRCLEYLLSLVERPHFGPWYKGMGESWYWEPGLNTEYDSYFISGPPEPCDCDPETFSLVYRYKALKRSPKQADWVCNPYASYLLFLMGVPGGDVRSATRYSFRDADCQVNWWPCLKEVFAVKGLK